MVTSTHPRLLHRVFESDAARLIAEETEEQMKMWTHSATTDPCQMAKMNATIQTASAQVPHVTGPKKRCVSPHDCMIDAKWVHSKAATVPFNEEIV